LLRADPKTIIPPFLELDRNDKTTPDLSANFSIDATESFSEVKKYFSRISQRKEDGSIWCSLIIAQSLSFNEFIDKARHSLENHSLGLWPKASDHASAAEVGWMLYSLRQQDETRLADLFSRLSGIQIRVKWRPIRTTDGSNRRRDSQDDSQKVYALHLEAASDQARNATETLKQWYGSGKTSFPDRTKMRLVPPFNTILSMANRGKYAALFARQAALTSCIGVGPTWELTTNLLLDKPHPTTGLSMRQILMKIPTDNTSNKPLFHAIDCQWWSYNVVNFCFLPEHESDARTIIAGLVPFLNDSYDPWYLKAFSTEAKQRHFSSHWDHNTRQVFSAEEAEISDILAEDNELNHTDIPTETNRNSAQSNQNVDFQVPRVFESSPHLTEDDDSVSTFHPQGTLLPRQAPQSGDNRPDISTPVNYSFQTPTQLPPPFGSAAIPLAVFQGDDGSVSKFSDVESKVADLESNLSSLSEQFRHAFKEFKQESRRSSKECQTTQSTLQSILDTLNIRPSTGSSTTPSDPANHPQTASPGGSSRAAGQGS